MRRIAIAVAALATGSVLAGEPGAATQAEAIEALGRLNGQALACNQPAIGSRARNAVVTTAPKNRETGAAFEAATNAAFLEQGRGGACPDVATLNRDLAEAESRLRGAFSTR